jgi:enoyl-CoA hydratase/carnithine racemase
VLDRLHQFVEAIRVFPKPVIAAVEGAAAGAGFFARARVRPRRRGRERALHPVVRQGRPHARRGATWHLGRRVPRQLAQQWAGSPSP